MSESHEVKGAARERESSSGQTKEARHGWITHTELTSNDPGTTRKWCAEVLGWTFEPSVPTPAGEYHVFAYADHAGGGIRASAPAEAPGALPYVEVPDVQAAFEKAIREGAEEMHAPERIQDDLTIAVVRAPGGVPVGFAGP